MGIAQVYFYMVEKEKGMWPLAYNKRKDGNDDNVRGWRRAWIEQNVEERERVVLR